MKQQHQTLEQIKHHFPPLHNVNQTHRQGLSSMDKLALWITEHVGTMTFFMLIFLDIDLVELEYACPFAASF